MNKNIIILAAVGVGAYFLLKRQNGAQPIIRTAYPSGTVPGQTSTRQQLDNLNNSTLYGIGNLLGGLFRGSGGGTSSAPVGSVLPRGTYTTNPNNWNVRDPSMAGDGYGPPVPDPSYAADGYGPPVPPDAYAVNPPGGYEQPWTVDVTDDPLYWN